ncbi:MAG TPA: type II toxin-antitoxin system HicB family antitoxin [Chloroflexota bacterium]|nr:type II toxin-antitoxin system HicB family antitoxin [Chloroflexota bacterium]
MDYLVVIHPAEEGGFWAEVPALGGCFAQGETIEEVLADAREAIAAHLEALRAEGRPIPTEQPPILATVRVPSPTAA